LEGRLDTNTSVELDAALSPVLDTINELVFDLSALEYISSAGLRVLLATHKSLSKKGGMKVTNVNEMIMEIFEVTGFSDILTIE
jgi:anti-sigma B factor antagonist